MSDTISFEISIPTDNDGYILLECSYCGAYFKLTVPDCQDDDLLHIWCPCCGLISESYLTEEVIELATVKAKNIALNYFYDSIKKLERTNKSNSIIKIKAGKRPEHERENPLYTRIDELTEYYYKCCKRNAKISPLQRMSASFCPFCGVIDFGNE